MSAPRVLTLVEWYLPGERAGGPVRTLNALVQRLDGRVHFDIVTRDRDHGDRLPYAGVETAVWLELDGHPERRRYLRPRDERPLALLRLLRHTPHDVLYLNTLYSGAFALYPLVFRRLGLLRRSRIVLAPRGQLDPGALAIARVKKRAYLSAVRGLGLLRDLEWHASSTDEEAHIRRLVPNAAIHLAPNLRLASTIAVSAPSPVGSVRVVFLSRISQKKNLDGALRMLGRCTSPIEFDIYGQQEDARYWRTCRRIIASLPKNVTCRYRGVVRHEDVSTVLADYDVLLLPTRGENFGHVIGEALEAGCLALVSDRTPWRGLAAQSAGWDLPLDDPSAFTAAIEQYAQLDEPQRIMRRTRAREFAARRDGDETHVAANLLLLLGSGATLGVSGSSATPAAPPGSDRRLLLLSPSAGLGGGIERVMDAIQANWHGRVERVDLIQPAHRSAGAAAPRPAPSVSPIAIARFTARVLRKARSFRPEIVVCGLLGLLPVASVVALPFRRKLALLAYGVDVWGSIGPLERVLIRRCTHLLTISSFTADAFGARAGLDPGGIEILALPMAEPIAAGAQGTIDDHAGRPPVVLTVSRLARSDRFKGHFEIARCFGRVLERRPDTRWVVVGDGDDLDALRSECRRLSIQHAVTFTGRICDDALIALYRTAAVFALPSVADADADPPVGEGFGLVYVEAGAFGLPIIAATPGGGSSEFVVDGETGLTVNPHAPDELADAIVRLLDDAQLRSALGERARARAFAHHLPEQFREALRHSLT
ncbi:MAG: hypothetical protein QOK16_2045 [Solirubrobacteraceae bacterium]|jgi:glycosyltransferase involved in cell wall biosynthesis|nr:hypothetical protein [Solirubrobacteraceae bacterium]